MLSFRECQCKPLIRLFFREKCGIEGVALVMAGILEGEITKFQDVAAEFLASGQIVFFLNKTLRNFKLIFKHKHFSDEKRTSSNIDDHNIDLVKLARDLTRVLGPKMVV